MRIRICIPFDSSCDHPKCLAEFVLLYFFKVSISCPVYYYLCLSFSFFATAWSFCFKSMRLVFPLSPLFFTQSLIYVHLFIHFCDVDFYPTPTIVSQMTNIKQFKPRKLTIWIMLKKLNGKKYDVRWHTTSIRLQASDLE